MLLVDTHAHVNFKAFKGDGDEAVKRALGNNVWLINVGAEFKTSKKAIELTGEYPEGVFAAIGLHPIHVKDEEFSRENYEELVRNSKVVAIGEIGLDYYHLKDMAGEPEEIKDIQKKVFIRQLEFAGEFKKPLIIHCRDAHDDLLEILKSKKSLLKTDAGVIHSFSGTPEQAGEYREMGFKIAFNGIITFARDYDEVVLDTPLEDVLLETDCPYLAPIPYRGKRNEPLYVLEVAKKLAEIKNLALDDVVRQTTVNAKKVFNLV